ncbi:hypothetical protein BGZ47_001615 [Haplosporangium gracile]|nr:hypothetical protein BGZ47_001590 [Haplosporangium gracile]KAF8948900.1 hypothetical protein BGZ47_001615 [Haplosporangium gracile]
MESTLEYAQSLLLDRLPKFIATYSSSSSKGDGGQERSGPVWIGVVLSLGLRAASGGASAASTQSIQVATNLGISLQSALVSMAAKEGTEAAAEAEKSATSIGTSVGKSQNLMSVDVVAVHYGIIYILLMTSTPLEIIVGHYPLYAQLGLSSLAGLGVVLFMTPV